MAKEKEEIKKKIADLKTKNQALKLENSQLVDKNWFNFSVIFIYWKTIKSIENISKQINFKKYYNKYVSNIFSGHLGSIHLGRKGRHIFGSTIGDKDHLGLLFSIDTDKLI